MAHIWIALRWVFFNAGLALFAFSGCDGSGASITHPFDVLDPWLEQQNPEEDPADESGPSKKGPGVKNPGDQRFVRVAGTHFSLNGKDFYFQGTNFYRLGILQKFTENQVEDALTQIAQKGMKVIRLWGFSCSGCTSEVEPILEWAKPDELGLNESALYRLDFTLNAAQKKGLKVILPLVNYWDEYCSMQWWTKQILGDSDKHKFYISSTVINAYKRYIHTILNRRNKINGIYYKDDPTIMAIELANEPHTENNYERNQGKQNGSIVHHWLDEMASYVRQLAPHQLIASGEEGYKVNHPDLTRNGWMHDGLKGVDFGANVALNNIDFATVHLYPDNWNIPSSDFDWINEHVVKDRAAIAHRANKPIILEEYGLSMDPQFQKYGYQADRRKFLGRLHQMVNQAGYAGTVVWQAVPPGTESDPYTFDFSDPAFKAISHQIQCMKIKSKLADSTLPRCKSHPTDTDGDGFGWENQTSCFICD
jgi:mannan endo-1,4-beta-mannosidase